MTIKQQWMLGRQLTEKLAMRIEQIIGKEVSKWADVDQEPKAPNSDGTDNADKEAQQASHQGAAKPAHAGGE
jgi:hypothetical protein